MGEEDTVLNKKKVHRERHSGRKADKKTNKQSNGIEGTEMSDKQRNPKAFAFNSVVRAERRFRRKQDIETKKQHIPVIDRSPVEPPPILVAVVGPPKVGKSTVINNLIKLFTKSPLAEIKGPVTIVTGKKRRVTLIECNNDINSMIDIAKIADLVLLLCDASFGFEMEIFEFLNICQVHGMPRIMGILTHLDAIKNSKTLKNTKKLLKHRFWTEVYPGAKLFYLSGIVHGEYLRNEIKNLGRFISIIKFRPLIWRTTHSYLLGDRFEDLTTQELIRKNPKCDRNISVYGYVRGVPLTKNISVHLAGLGDLKIHDVSYLPDPCPLPEIVKKRSLIEKEKLIYAPFSGVGGIVYDKDAVYVELGGSHSHNNAPTDNESKNMVSNLIDTKETLDTKMKRSEMQIFTGGTKLTAKDLTESSTKASQASITNTSKKTVDSDLENELNQLKNDKNYSEMKHKTILEGKRARRKVIFDQDDHNFAKTLKDSSDSDSSDEGFEPKNTEYTTLKENKDLVVRDKVSNVLKCLDFVPKFDQEVEESEDSDSDSSDEGFEPKNTKYTTLKGNKDLGVRDKVSNVLKRPDFVPKFDQEVEESEDSDSDSSDEGFEPKNIKYTTLKGNKDLDVRDKVTNVLKSPDFVPIFDQDSSDEGFEPKNTKYTRLKGNKDIDVRDKVTNVLKSPDFVPKFDQEVEESEDSDSDSSDEGFEPKNIKYTTLKGNKDLVVRDKVSNVLKCLDFVPKFDQEVEESEDSDSDSSDEGFEPKNTEYTTLKENKDLVVRDKVSNVLKCLDFVPKFDQEVEESEDSDSDSSDEGFEPKNTKYTRLKGNKDIDVRDKVTNVLKSPDFVPKFDQEVEESEDSDSDSSDEGFEPKNTEYTTLKENKDLVVRDKVSNVLKRPDFVPKFDQEVEDSEESDVPEDISLKSNESLVGISQMKPKSKIVEVPIEKKNSHIYFDNNSDEERNEEERDDEERDDEDMAMKWKENLNIKARDAFLNRQKTTENIMKLVYGVFDKHGYQPKEPSNEDKEDIGGLFRVVTLQKEKIEEREKVNSQESSLFNSWDKEPKDWLKPENKILITNCFVTGKWKQSEDASELLKLDDMKDFSDDNSDIFGDFEDLETGEKHSADLPTSGLKRKLDDTNREALIEKKRKLKEKFDTEYDNTEITSYYDDLKTSAEKQAQINKSVFENMPDDLRVQIEGFRAGMYVRIEFQEVPCEFISNFDPTCPLVIGALNIGEENIGYVNVKIKKHRWYKKILKTSDPLIISLGWRRFQTQPLFSKFEDDMKYRYLKYTPEHITCNAHFWGPITPQGTGFLALQSVEGQLENIKSQGFRIAATGSVQELEKSTQIMKKLKLIGHPIKIYKKTAFIKDMFNSALEVAKFEGARIKTVSGIRGQIKKASGKPEGCFRATFEDKILLSDIVFCRTWYKVDVPKFYCPVTTLLLPVDKKRSWQGARTTGQIKYDEGIKNEPDYDSLYTPITREIKPPKPLIIPRKLQKQLPYRDKPKFTPLKSDLRPNPQKKRIAVIREPHEQKVAKMLQMLRASYEHKQAQLKTSMAQRMARHQAEVGAQEAQKVKREKRERKEIFRQKSKAKIREEKKGGKKI